MIASDQLRKKNWRFYWGKFKACWNLPTIFLLLFLLVAIWSFRFYCLDQPLDSSPFLEWDLEVWVVIDAVMFFLLLRTGGWMRFPILIIVSLWGTIHLTSAKVYGALLHYGQVASAMETNGSETAGYLEFLGFFPFAVFIGLFLIFWGLTWKTSRTGWLGWCVFVGLSFCPLLEVAIPALLGVKYSQAYEFIHFPAEKMKQRYINSLIYRYPSMIGQYVSIQRRMIEAAHKERKLPEGVSLPVSATNKNIPKRIVIVLGETDWRMHHGAYGYPHGTDHFMMGKSKDIRHAALFNAISPASVTREAVARLMTFATPKDALPFSENMGIVDMAKAAGYQTNWFSRQTSTGIHDTLVRIVAQQADKTIYLDSGRDEVLIDPLVAEFSNKKQLLLMHIWGGHMTYADRHDESDYQLAFQSSEEFRHYDAALGHIDKVLASLTKYGDHNTLFIYIPDHGEIINLGHGTSDMAFAQYDIPFYAWSSNSAYIARFRQIVRQYLVPIHGKIRFNTGAFPFVMAELMGYRISDQAKAKALEDSMYVLNVDGLAYPVTAIKWDQ